MTGDDAHCIRIRAVLDLPLPDNPSGAATVRGYLAELLDHLWIAGSDFSAKRPFGASDWQWVIYEALAGAGFIDGINDTDTADALIVHAIHDVFDAALRVRP